MNGKERLVRAVHKQANSRALRLTYARATGVNTVLLDGGTVEVTLPAIAAVADGDYAAILVAGTDHLILGPVV